MVFRFSWPQFNANADYMGFRGAASDITERIEREQTLHKSEQRFQDFADASADWFWETNKEFRFTYLSKKRSRICGCPPERFYGMTREDMLSDDHDRKMWREHEKYLARRQPFRDFVYHWEIDGLQPRWFRVSGKPVFDTEGAFLGYRGTGSDVTGEIEARERTARLESRLMDAMENMSDGFALFDADDRFVLCNGRYRQMYAGIADLLAPGTSFEELLSAGAERGRVPEAVGRADEWVAGTAKTAPEFRKGFRRISRGRPLGTDRRSADQRWRYRLHSNRYLAMEGSGIGSGESCRTPRECSRKHLPGHHLV